MSFFKRGKNLDLQYTYSIISGFVTHEEVVMFQNVECKYNKFWVPLVWANSVLTQARKEGRIESDIGFRLIMEVFRKKDICYLS